MFMKLVVVDVCQVISMQPVNMVASFGSYRDRISRVSVAQQRY